MGAAQPPSRPGSERNSFVGRRQELADIRQRLCDARLLTLVGPGGVGKTRLAVRAAHDDLAQQFPDGTFTVDLAAVSSSGLVAQQVAAALHVREPSEPVTDHLAQVVGDRTVLLVLDNCEHVRDGVATVVHRLLDACPQLSVLCTSRLPLDVDGESLLVVPPLPLAPRGAAPEDVEACEAVQLLQERARAVAPTLVLSPDAGAHLLDICRRLDGLPLAIELAAVRLRTLGPVELLDRLDDRFRLLQRSGTTIPERHRTLLATMQWSHDLLDEHERLLWRRASVFVGGFDATAAESVCADAQLPVGAVLDALTALVDASVVGVSTVDGVSSFRMLETVRAFGQTMLAAAGEVAVLRQRHRRWISSTAVEASAQFLGPEQVAAFDVLGRHHSEISAALEHCLTTPGEESAGLAIAADLWLYWEARGRLGEGRRRVQELLARCPDDEERPRALAVAGYLELAATEPATARPLLAEARSLARTTGDAAVAATATQYLGQAALFDGDLDTAETLLRDAAAQHLPVDRRMSAFCWADVGVVRLLQHRPHEAAEAFSLSLELNAEGNPWSRAHALWGLGLVHLGWHDAARAREMEQESLTLMQAVGDTSGSALCVGALACVAAGQEQWERAARLAGAERMLWASIPAAVPAPVVALHHDYRAATAQALGARRWTEHLDRGSTLGRTAAVALALGQPLPSEAVPEPGSGLPGGPAGGSHLTDRQLEVATLVAQGMTDRQIAAHLVISPRTAESHVQNILTRLGLRNRAEIAAWSVRRVPS
ncbi:LuxR C-terminal-related transcriptional regulator [Ornithinimicrobium sp. W1679]|uniref:LuxR C-terminal-related transcriptional regulator n=1 Tax=Ornithinimicrobium sp. W1679 TaxID=3418770 RepID=UPI003CE93DE4